MMIASAKPVVVSTNKRKKSLKVANSPPTTLKYCDKCDFSSNDMNEFSEHMRFEHSMDEIYPCDLCSFYTQSLWDYQVHMEKAHRDQKLDESEGEDIVDEQLVDEDEPDEDEEEEEDDEDEEDAHKDSILYSSSSSSISVDPKKINSDQEQSRNSLLNKSQVNDKMLFDLANQYSNPNQLSQLIQKYNQHLSSQACMGAQPRLTHLPQQIQNVAPSHHEKTKRHYNSEVDPARYRKVLEDGITKFACSICGNTYKWRKSLNKHWKEKHITETPPPLDAPVAVKLRNGNTTLNCSNSSLNANKKHTNESTNSQISNTLNLFQQYLSSMTKADGGAKHGEDGSAPLDLSMKPKRERSRSVSASQRSNSASSTSSSSNTSSSGSSSDSCDTAAAAAAVTTTPAPAPLSGQVSLADSTLNESINQSPIPKPPPSQTPSQLNTSQVYNQKLFICSVCDAKFHVVDQINEHFLKNHYNEYQRELSSKSPPRNTNVAQQNEEWNLSDPQNPLKCIKCDFVGRWPTELQKHAASHSTSRPFKCLICSLTYKWRWDLAKHFDRTHPTFRNPYKKRDRDAARSTLINPMQSASSAAQGQVRKSRSRSRSNESDEHKKPNKYEQISINPHTPPLSSSSSSSSSTCSLQAPFLPPFMSPQSQNTAAMYAAYLLANPALLSNPLFAMAALQNVHATPNTPNTATATADAKKKPNTTVDDSSDSMKMVKSSPSNSSLSKKIKLDESADEKESRNFQCFWCDFRGRWRSEIIQHMRCHHAREKPYRCSSCMYASNWKWDVQKHTKKQHPNATAKIVEIPDQVLFPDLKDLNFFDTIKPIGGAESPKKSALNLTPPSSSSSSSSTSSISSVSSIRPVKKSTTLNCHQCPYVACNLSDLRRHLIVHSNEQPYHCCSCAYKSKWKSDVKKHQRSSGHIGPILVGKKAMQKVIETLGLDKRNQLPNIDVIDNRQCKSNEKLIDEEELSADAATAAGGKRKRPADDSDEEVYEQLNEDDEYFDDDEEPHEPVVDHFEQEFAPDESAELEIDQDDDEY